MFLQKNCLTIDTLYLPWSMHLQWTAFSMLPMLHVPRLSTLQSEQQTVVQCPYMQWIIYEE